MIALPCVNALFHQHTADLDSGCAFHVFPVHKADNFCFLWDNSKFVAHPFIAVDVELAVRNSINLGSVYETVVASELIAHGHKLFYYDNRSKGEVDFLIDDYDSLSAVPIEVKSGKDYTVHSALNTFVQNKDYHIKKAFVVSNERNVTQNGKITYIPIYYIMFFNADWSNKNLQF